MKIVLLTNILTPFRVYFYDMLFEEYRRNNIDFSVLVMVPSEPGRQWQYEKLKREYTILLKGSLRKVSGIDWIVNEDIKEKLETAKPDVVVCAGSYMNPSVWKTLQLKKKLGYKVLFWSESHLNEKRNYGRVKLLLRTLIRKKVLNLFDGFWYAGKMSKEFIDYYVKGKKHCIFVPNIIHEDVYFAATQYTQEQRKHIRADKNISIENILIFIPARLSKEKGILEFLSLLNQCKHKNSVTIVISGEGELKKEIENKAAEYGIDVRLLGFQNQQQMVELYAASDIFALPSISDPNPLTCIEASWAAKPLLISEHVGNNPEILERGKNGDVFDYQNENKAVEIIEQMITSDKTWLNDAGRISLEIAKERYNSKNNIARVAKETAAIVGN